LGIPAELRDDSAVARQLIIGGLVVAVQILGIVGILAGRWEGGMAA
jgi:hypothetical protein